MGRYSPYPAAPYAPSPYGYYAEQPPQPTRPGQATGTVKWYNEPKGFGFLVPAGGGADIYFKGTDVVNNTGGPLATGEVVTWEVMTATDQEAKQWAINITRRNAGYPPPTPDPRGYQQPSYAYPSRSTYADPAYPQYEPYPAYTPDPYAYSNNSDPYAAASYSSAYPSSTYSPPPVYPSSADPYRSPYPTNGAYDPYAQQPPSPTLYDPSNPTSRSGTRLPGVVKWYNEQKAFGFLCPVGSVGDVYFRGSDVNLSGGPPLKTDDAVVYDLVKANDAEGKSWAVNITRSSTPVAPSVAPTSGGGGFKRKSTTEVDGGAKRFSQARPYDNQPDAAAFNPQQPY